MDDQQYGETVNDAQGTFSDFAVPKIIVFLGLNWPVECPHRVVEIDAVLRYVGLVFDVIPFKFQQAASSPSITTNVTTIKPNLKQKIPLRHRQNMRRLAYQQFPVRPNLISLRVHFNVGHGAVVDHRGL